MSNRTTLRPRRVVAALFAGVSLAALLSCGGHGSLPAPDASRRDATGGPWPDASDDGGHEADGGGDAPRGIGTRLCIYPVPNPTLDGMPAFEDSYAKAADLGASVVTFYYKLADLDADLARGECILRYLVPLAERFDLELAIEIEAPEPPGVLDHLPSDLQGLDFRSPVLRERYLELVSAFLDAVGAHDPNRRLKYLFFGNEVDSYLGTHPGELEDWTVLLAELVRLTRRRCPWIQAGTVVTYHDALAHDRLELVERHLGPVSDIIAVTFYPEWLPAGYEPGELHRRVGDLVSVYSGTWSLALVEGGVSADPLRGGSESRQTAYVYEYAAAVRAESAELEFASLMFSVFPLVSGEPPFSDWVAGVSVYRSDGSPRPVRDAMLEAAGSD